MTVKSLTENFDLDTHGYDRLFADSASVTQAARTLKISRSTAYSALATTR